MCPKEALMTRRVRSSVRPAAVSVGLLLGFLALAVFTAASPAQDAKPNRYIGAAKCMNCHQFEGGGNQYGAWEAARHSSAFDVLATDEAKRIATELGIEDATCKRS